MINRGKESLGIKVAAVVLIVCDIISLLAFVGAVDESRYFYTKPQFVIGFIGFVVCIFGLLFLDKPSRFTQIPIALIICILAFIYDRTEYEPKNSATCYDLYLDCNESYWNLFAYTCCSWKKYCDDGYGWFLD